MTNTQQVILEPAADQPQEEVQLTELRPVEHSRINAETLDERDGDDATDGLKALRSFSQRQLDELELFGAGYPRKRKAERWKHINGSNEFGLDNECYEKIAARNGNGAKAAQIEDSLHSDEIEDDEDEDEEFYVNGDFDYLEGRNEDEIYVYRQQQESCSSPDIEASLKNISQADAKETQTNGQTNGQREEEKTEKSQAETVVIRRPRGRPRKKKNIKKKKEAVVDRPPPPPATKENESVEEKELQSKINDIIQANYLMEQENMEQENNNIVEEHSKAKAKSVVNSQSSSVEKKSESESEEVKKYCCALCKARFKGGGGLRNHYKVVHKTSPWFKCDECGKEFPLKERLKLHLRTHTGFKPYKCPDCDKSFARGGQLAQHRRSHSQVRPYSCNLCPGTFTCSANLALHLKRHNGQKDHKCDICGRAFIRRDALKKHLECLHKDVKSFQCHICNKTFKGHLPQHMRTHAQDRPHGCATCGQRFAQKSQLTVHQRTHSGQRPFRCLVCWQAFAHSTALKLHTRRHTGERPFKCAECNAGFTQLPHWKKHMKCIHGRSEPYNCRKCNTFFRMKTDLEAHEKDCQAEPKDEGGSSSSDPGNSEDTYMAKVRNMSIEKMRLLLAVLLKRISKPERLDELGFGKRLIDEVLVDSLISAGKEAVEANHESLEFEALKTNLAVFLEWTVPKAHWENFRKMKKTPEEVLETLTAT